MTQNRATHIRHDGHAFLICHVTKWHLCALVLINAQHRVVDELDVGKAHWNTAYVGYRSRAMEWRTADLAAGRLFASLVLQYLLSSA